MKRSLPLNWPLLLAVVLFPLTLCAQKPKENCLLWRISGNGLTKPSWVYGTIHLTDRRVFDFGDSLYAALEASEGYAMEIAPDSIVNSALKKINEKTELLKNLVSAKDFARLKPKLQQRFDKKPETVTVQEFRNYFLRMVNKPDKDDMHTIMDAWFYDAMHRQGKWVGGIEDLADQEKQLDEMPLDDYIADFLDDHRESRKSIEKLIAIYKSEDLMAINKVEGYGGGSFAEDSIMLRRNHKMSLRMDSLSHMRSTFFAVGAAHLPGDSGVISSLRRRGFTVQPVISNRRIHASDWHFTVREIPWVTVSATNGHYTVQMPGEPQQMGLSDENADMKMYADIGSNLFFISMSAEKGDKDIDTLMAEAMKNLTRKAKIQKTRPINKDGVEGKEILAKSPEATYRIHFYYRSPIVYMAMAGSTADTLVYSKDADRFLQSLVMHKKVKSNYVAWSVYTSDQHAFSVKFPGKPTSKQDPDDGDNVITHTYASLDLKNEVYFQCMVQDMKKGFYLTGDTSAFGAYRDYLAGIETLRVLRQRLDTVQQYPAMWTEFMREDGNGTFYNKVLSLHRGNRIYHLFATAADSVKSRQVVNDYFSSFTFIPVKETKWQMEPAPDNSFTLWSPAPVTKYLDTADRFDDAAMFEMYDAVTPCTYYLKKSAYSPYFWTDSDTTLLQRAINGAVDYNDTLLSKKEVTNGNYRGVEIVVGLNDNHNVKKMRLLLVGDSLFTLYGIGAPEFMALDNSRRLFEEFRVNHTVPTTLFTNKAAQLLKALESADSTQFLAGKKALTQVSFTKKDLPLLHKAMTGLYRDSGDYNNVNTLLCNAVADLKDESTLPVVEQLWEQLPASHEKLRYGLLEIVAAHKTAASAALVKKLLLNHPPQKGESYRLFYKFSDSLELIAPIFPELLPLLNDSLAGPQIISLAEELLDSNLVDVRIVLNHKKQLYYMAETALKLLQDDEHFWWYNYHSLVRLLAKLKEPAANQWVRKYLLQSNMYLKHTAAVALLKAGQPVETTELLKLAADKEQRIDLYRELAEMKKLALFPKQYLTEQAFAESELYSYASEDNTVKKITFIGERIVLYKGVRKRFFLYRVDMSYEDEKIIHLGIAGPYGLKPAKPVTETKATGIYWEKEYNSAKIDTYLKAFLKEREQYDTEQ
jgi:uncharacterized protein YbaP (TraB family)